MDNPNDKNQSNPNNDYQDILNKYAASIKPETNEEIADPQQFLKETNSLQIEPSAIETTPEPIESNPEPIESTPETEDIPSTEPIYQNETNLKPQPDIEITPEPQILETEVSEPEVSEKTPEQIKEEVNQILDIKPNNLNLFKIFFIVSLFIFLIVVGVLIYTLFSNSNNSSSNNSSITPTTTISSDIFCELNGFKYQQGASFPSADGCNTCTCESQNVIACTEKACAPTPIATKSATTSSIPKDWKTYADKTSGLSFKYPADWSVLNSYPNGVTIQSSDFKSEKSFYKISNGSFITIYFNPPTSNIKDDDESLIKYASIYMNKPGKPDGSEFINFNGERTIGFYYPVAGENLNSGNAYIFIKDNKEYTLNQEYKSNSNNPYPELLKKILFDLKFN